MESQTIIVEFPATACTRGRRRSDAANRAAAQRAHPACGVPNTSEFLDLCGTATITGVGFFDFKPRPDGCRAERDRVAARSRVLNEALPTTARLGPSYHRSRLGRRRGRRKCVV